MSSIFYQNEVMKKKAMSMTHLTCVKAEHGLFAVKLSYLIRDGSKNMNLNINSVSVAGAEPVNCLMSYSQWKSCIPRGRCCQMKLSTGWIIPHVQMPTRCSLLLFITYQVQLSKFEREKRRRRRRRSGRRRRRKRKYWWRGGIMCLLTS